MDNEQLVQRLMVTFLEELEEHVQALNDGLLAIEKDPPDAERAELIQTLFRTAHSLKGASRAVGVKPVENVCHQMESLLAGVRDERPSLDPERFALLYATADAIGNAGQQLRAGRPPDADSLGDLATRLTGAARRTAGASGPASPESPASGQPPGRTETARADEDEEPQAETETVITGTEGQTGSIRIAGQRLDGLLAQSGELLLARHRVESRLEALDTLREVAVRSEVEWRPVRNVIGQLMGEKGNGHSDLQTLRREMSRCLPLLDQTGETLDRLARDLGRLVVSLGEDTRALSHTARAFDADIRDIRMLPFVSLRVLLERTLRDLAAASGKEVELRVTGGQTEIDRSILDSLKDPLLHLVRNAIDHGVEAPDERQAAGKPPRATVTVSAAVRGSHIEVVVSDDGRGLDLDAIRMRALKKKTAVPSEDAEVARLIFLPGFSTATLITEVSGRGVGLDVVQSKVEAMRGSVDVAWEEGRGTRFVISVPLTLTTLRVLLVRAGGQTLALDGTAVRRMVRVAPGEFRTVEGRDMILVGASPVRVASLAQALVLPATELTTGARTVPIVILETSDGEAAFVVEELLSVQEVVVKSLGPRLRRVRHVAAATILPTGHVAPILNVSDLMRGTLGRSAGSLAETLEAGATEEARKRLLVVDDSVTSRSLLQSVLDTAGYDVTTAVDGAAAWQLLQEQGADMVVSDVEMPRMDGFKLTEAIRASTRFGDLPVILVTARSTAQDKTRGLEVGANAYLVKSAFDQQTLIDAVAQLL